MFLSNFSINSCLMLFSFIQRIHFNVDLNYSNLNHFKNSLSHNDSMSLYHVKFDRFYDSMLVIDQVCLVSFRRDCDRSSIKKRNASIDKMCWMNKTELNSIELIECVLSLTIVVIFSLFAYSMSTVSVYLSGCLIRPRFRFWLVKIWD